MGFGRPSRRSFLGAGLSLSGLSLASGAAGCGPGGTGVRIGYQKNGVLLVAKLRGETEAALKAAGAARVAWSEFSSGPPLLEALNAGALDFGATGDTPPILAQAAGSTLVYAAAVPLTGAAAAVLTPKDSGLRSVADLRGAKLAFAKGSSAEGMAAALLAGVGLTLGDVKAVNLSPADGIAAMTAKAVDAWIIWDPFYALAEQSGQVRVLASARGAVRTYQFFLARRAFAETSPQVLRALIAHLGATGAWAKAHPGETAALMSRETGVELAVQRRVAERQDYAVGPLKPEIIADQQALADSLFERKIAPARVDVRAAVWSGALAAGS